jgi:hypothetical protein
VFWNKLTDLPDISAMTGLEDLQVSFFLKKNQKIISATTGLEDLQVSFDTRSLLTLY